MRNFPLDNASKHCMSDGRWYIHNGLNKTWTNYTSCYNQRQQNQPTMVPTLVQVISYIYYYNKIALELKLKVSCFAFYLNKRRVSTE